MNTEDWLSDSEMVELQKQCNLQWFHPAVFLIFGFLTFMSSLTSLARGETSYSIFALILAGIAAFFFFVTFKRALEFRNSFRELLEERERAFRNDSVLLIAEIEVYLSKR